MASPTIKLNSGHEMPVLGLGTWKSKPGTLANAVSHAIKSGYRHIDCAIVYGNEGEVGQGLKEALATGDVKREELFITSKLPNNAHHPDDVKPTLKKSLELLGVDYLDLYLIHWPFSFRRGDDYVPKDDSGKIILAEEHYLPTWKVMEECVKEGLVRSIGLSNFNSKQISDVWENSTIKPAVLQVECSPYNTQKELMAFCKEKGIVLTGFGPLASSDHPVRKPEDPSLFTEPSLKAIAEKYGKTIAQIVLRWNIQRGFIVIPKSVTPSRIEENMNVFDFSLTEEEVGEIEKLHRGWRSCWFHPCSAHKLWPFNEPY